MLGFCFGNTELDIEIAVTFYELSQEARELFSAYIDNDSLTVVRIFSDPVAGKSGTYHGNRRQNPDFAGVRHAEGARDAQENI